MNLQSSLALKFFNKAINRYCELRLLIHSFITWSPFLTRVFNETLRVRRWRLLQFVLKLLRFVLPNPINVEGHVLFHHPNDYITTLSLGIEHEPEIKKTITRFLRPGMTMIDAGANLGYFTLLAARAVGPQGHVYAFEPVPSTVALLRKNVEVNGYSDRVTIVPKAVTDKSSQIRIFLDDVASGISSIFSSGHEKDFVDVEGVSMDGYFSKQAWPCVHMIKMDIEGAEKLALNGMRELSYRNQELKLIIEMNSRHVSLDLLAEAFEALHGCGFSRFYLLEDHSRVVNTFKDIPPGEIMNLLCEKAN